MFYKVRHNISKGTSKASRTALGFVPRAFYGVCTLVIAYMNSGDGAQSVPQGLHYGNSVHEHRGWGLRAFLEVGTMVIAYMNSGDEEGLGVRYESAALVQASKQ